MHRSQLCARIMACCKLAVLPRSTTWKCFGLLFDVWRVVVLSLYSIVEVHVIQPWWCVVCIMLLYHAGVQGCRNLAFAAHVLLGRVASLACAQLVRPAAAAFLHSRLAHCPGLAWLLWRQMVTFCGSDSSGWRSLHSLHSMLEIGLDPGLPVAGVIPTIIENASRVCVCDRVSAVHVGVLAMGWRSFCVRGCSSGAKTRGLHFFEACSNVFAACLFHSTRLGQLCVHIDRRLNRRHWYPHGMHAGLLFRVDSRIAAARHRLQTA
jgi:hypothetical protein